MAGSRSVLRGSISRSATWSIGGGRMKPSRPFGPSPRGTAKEGEPSQNVHVCRAVFNQGDDFVKKITGNPNVDRPLQRIREFRNRPNPKIVVTVDMLSTGVDIPALEFIVFLRLVKSRILCGSRCSDAASAFAPTSTSPSSSCSTASTARSSSISETSPASTSSRRAKLRSRSRRSSRTLAERGPRLPRAHPGQAPPAD